MQMICIAATFNALRDVPRSLRWLKSAQWGGSLLSIHAFFSLRYGKFIENCGLKAVLDKVNEEKRV